LRVFLVHKNSIKQNITHNYTAEPIFYWGYCTVVREFVTICIAMQHSNNVVVDK
jgi:hypothetical protein